MADAVELVAMILVGIVLFGVGSRHSQKPGGAGLSDGQAFDKLEPEMQEALDALPAWPELRTASKIWRSFVPTGLQARRRSGPEGAGGTPILMVCFEDLEVVRADGSPGPSA